MIALYIENLKINIKSWGTKSPPLRYVNVWISEMYRHRITHHNTRDNNDIQCVRKGKKTCLASENNIFASQILT